MRDPKNKREDIDLPDPELRRNSIYKTEDHQVQWNRLLRIAVVAITAYSLLHKILVPFVLKFTTVSQIRYKEIDESWVFGVLFCVSLFVGGGQKQVARALGVGCALALGIHELYRFFIGDNPGWLGLSRALSSGPMAFLGILIFVRRLNKNHYAVVASSCVISLVVMLVMEKVFVLPGTIESPAVAVSQLPSNTLMVPQTQSTPQLCGAQEMTLNSDRLGNWEVKENQNWEVQVESCGFNPSAGFVGSFVGAQIQFINKLNRSLNVHLWIYRKSDRRRNSLNFVIPPFSQSKKVQGEVLQDAHAILVVSDNHREMGMTLLVESSLRGRKISAQAYPPRLQIGEEEF